MAEIKQELGFDASKAIQALARLDTALKSYNQGMNSSIGAMKSFNQQAGKTVSALKKLASNGKAAADQLQKVANLQGKTPTVVSTVATPVSSKKAKSSVDDYIAQFDKMFAANEKSSDSQKRMRASNIANAAQFAQKHGISIDAIKSQMQNLDKVYQGKSNTMANHLNKMGNSAKDNAKKWTVSWETIGRVVATQVIVRALSTIREALKSAVKGAVDFQKAVAEIGTILPKIGLEDISDMVRGVSDAFNIGLDDTAEAAYETISNQIASTRKEIESFLGSAAKFSKVTKTAMPTSINLLSGTLNAFGKDVSEVEDIAAKFFTTIDLGRIRADELDQGMGSIAPTASKLGISLEELNAALATLTIGGVQANKAFTQIRGAMVAFMKPTTAMQKAMKKLDISTAEELLATLDLQEAIRAIIDTTDGSSASVAKLFPRIRGLTGVLGLAEDKTEHFTKTMNEQKKALEDTYDKAYKLVLSTDAEQVTKELNEISNYFTTDFGDAVLSAANNFSKAIGGAKNFKSIMDQVGAALPAVATGLGLLGTAILALKAKSLLAGGALGKLVPILQVLAAWKMADIGGQIISAKIDMSLNKELKAFIAGMEQETKLRALKIDKEIALEKAKVSTITDFFNTEMILSKSAYNKVVLASIEKNQTILSDVKSTTDAIIAEHERMASAYASTAANVGAIIVASQKRSSNARDTLEEKLFQRSIKRDSERIQVSKLTRRANELAADAESKMRRATTEKQRSTASEEFSKAQALVDQALAIADQTGNRNLQKKALNSLKSLTNDLTSSEKIYQQTVARSQKILAQRANKESKRVEKLKAKQLELLDAYSLFNKDTGKALSPEERVSKVGDAQKLMREFITLSGKPMDVSSMLNFANVEIQMANSLQRFRIQKLQVSEDALLNIQSQVQTALENAFKGNIVAMEMSRLTGIKVKDEQSEIEAMDKIKSGYANALEVMGQYQKIQDVISASEFRVAGAFENTTDAIRDYKESFAGIDAKTFPSVKTYLADVESAQKLMKKASEGMAIHPDEVTRAMTALQESSSQVPKVLLAEAVAMNDSIAISLRELQKLLDARKKMRDMETTSGVSMDNAAEIAKWQTFTNILAAPKIAAEAMKAATDATALALGNMASSPALSTWIQIRANAEATQRASEATARSMSNAMNLASGYAHGGKIGYFASGGRGTDTIPAMLSAGEYVTNVRSSRRFFSQLQAMNAGQNPVYRNEGGDTFNTNVGDINVSGAGKPTVVAREVMKAIRREERRGSGR